MPHKADAITVMVKNQMEALLAHGVPPERAGSEAEERVARVIEELSAIGLKDVYISVALRRAKVYRLRCQGVPVLMVKERLGICKNQVVIDYRDELLRRRELAQAQS